MLHTLQEQHTHTYEKLLINHFNPHFSTIFKNIFLKSTHVKRFHILLLLQCTVLSKELLKMSFCEQVYLLETLYLYKHVCTYTHTIKRKKEEIPNVTSRQAIPDR